MEMMDNTTVINCMAIATGLALRKSEILPLQVLGSGGGLEPSMVKPPVKAALVVVVKRE